MAVSKAVRLMIFSRDRLLCHYCGQLCEMVANPAHQPPETATIDHVVPGGGDMASNLVTACKRCNSAKRDRTADQYRAWLVERYDSEDTRL